ncbi:MAG: FIST C-terminal domain-containing protein [Proteobacteria bacterium]|nr:FIST C-terminal domain-containing protein [Pseudomonadota bacterium]
MKTEQIIWKEDTGWLSVRGESLKSNAQLVCVFGTTAICEGFKVFQEIRELYPEAHILGCSTAGEICGTSVYDNSIVVTAIQFESTHLKGAKIELGNVESSFEAGEQLARSIDKENLTHVFVLSDGLNVNGSELVRGLTGCLPEGVTITGGLAADGARFGKTLVCWDDIPKQNTIAIVGFYGNKLKIGFGSMGGWDPFGPERLITKSKENVLYELDGKSALETYKLYLGEHAKGLPATGLLFPLSIRTKSGQAGIVRTILSVDDENQSMTFAGDIPEGAYARFMKANFERLIDGAHGAAKTSYEAIDSRSPDLAILISCVGRKLVLKQRTEEEVEIAGDIFGNHTTMTGFYSYGEISPFMPGAQCSLHNQTMTITTFFEEK